MSSRNRKARTVVKLCSGCKLPQPHALRSHCARPRQLCLACTQAYLKQWRAEHWAELKVRDTLRGMIDRCHNPARMKRWAMASGIPGAWRDYGAAGVSVCDEWRAPGGLEAFLAHVGLPPTKLHTLDRIDPELPYRPGNVRWATKDVQDANRKNSRFLPGFDPETGDLVELTLSEWARRLGIGRNTLARRLKALPIEHALSAGERAEDAALPELSPEELAEDDEPEVAPDVDPGVPF